MTSIKSIVGLALAGTLVAGIGVAQADQVNSAERSIAVRYTKGDLERYVVAWTGDVGLHVWESGGPAIPLQGKFVDDRVCHWEINGNITRQVFLVSRTGKHFASPTLTRVYDKGKGNEGASFKLVGLRGENCGDAAGRRNSDVADMKKLVGNDFAATVQADFGAVQSELRQNSGVIKVYETGSEASSANTIR